MQWINVGQWNLFWDKQLTLVKRLFSRQRYDYKSALRNSEWMAIYLFIVATGQRFTFCQGLNALCQCFGKEYYKENN